jgi:hypothetical protein
MPSNTDTNNVILSHTHNHSNFYKIC